MRKISIDLGHLHRDLIIRGNTITDQTTGQTAEIWGREDILKFLAPQATSDCWQEDDYAGSGVCLAKLDPQTFLRLNYTFGSCEECDEWLRLQNTSYSKRSKPESLIAEALGDLELDSPNGILLNLPEGEFDYRAVEDFVSKAPTRRARVTLPDDDDDNDDNDWW